MSCFIIGQMTGLTNKQVLLYSQAQSTFLRIQAYDAEIRIKRIAGNKSLPYYAFEQGEQALYNMGQSLLYQNDPVNAAAGLYNSVSKI